MTSSTYIRFKFGLLSQTECSLCSFHKGLCCCLSCSSIEDASSILNTDWDGKLLQQITTGNNAVFESLFLHVSARSWCLAFFISWNYSVLSIVHIIHCWGKQITCLVAIFSGACLFLFYLLSSAGWGGQISLTMGSCWNIQGLVFPESS